MKFKLLLVSIICFFNVSLKAQLVYLTDYHWRDFLVNHGFSSCISGDTLDASCSTVTSTTILDCSNKSITAIDGIQYFTGLQIFNCSNNFLTAWPQFPNSITQLNVSYNQMVNQPYPLPTQLVTLDCSFNNFMVANIFPSTLTTLNCSGNAFISTCCYPSGLTTLIATDNVMDSLPALPSSVTYLDVSKNNFSGNFIVPQNLIHFACYSNHITSFSSLPQSIRYLDISSNPLYTLPLLPDSLTQLHCINDSLSTLGTDLPSTLTILDAGQNLLTRVDSIPSDLQYFYVGYNQIDSLGPLPSGLLSLNIGSNTFTTLPELPSGLRSLQCAINNISVIDSFPTSLRFFQCDQNPITYLPAFPPSLKDVIARSCDIQYLVSLNDTMTRLLIDDNPIACLPYFKKISNISIDSTNIQCLPERIICSPCNMVLDTIPVCGLSDGCPVFWNITGELSHDLNADCDRDAGENILTNIPVMLDSSGTLLQISYTDEFGKFYFRAPMGNYSVYVDTLIIPFNMSCPANAIQNISLTPSDSIVDSLQYNMICKLTDDQLVKSVTAFSHRFVPGQITKVNVNAGDASTYHSTVCFHEPGTLKVLLSSNVSYDSPMPGSLAPTSVSGDTLIWNIADFSLVDPENDFDFLLLTDTTAISGDSVCIQAQVFSVNDLNPSNNIIAECFPVVASLDPNEKTVSPSAADTSVHSFTFTVYFQNTGTAPAANIYILDTLDTDLDASTFELLGSSHDVVTQLLPGNVLRFNYHAIELPDSTSDEVNSHGFVKYRVRRNSNTGAGTEITNTAHIYFDYNEAVVTNTVSVLIDLPNGIKNVNSNSSAIVLYPNPATSSFKIESKEGAINSVEVFDMLGNKIFSRKDVNSNYMTISVSGMQKGVYVVNVRDEKNIITAKRLIIN